MVKAWITIASTVPKCNTWGTPLIYTKKDSKESIMQAEKIVNTVKILLEKAHVLKESKKEK
jgi:HEPN domain-containing protein